MRSYSSRFYDQYFVGVEGDVAFYAGHARCSSGPILEVGCGSGRVTLPLARAGAEIVGMDVDVDLLALARAKLAQEDCAIRDRVELISADMTDFDLDRQFAQIHIPYRTFQHLLTPIDQIEVLHGLAEHLEDGGLLFFDTFDPVGELIANGLVFPLAKDTDFIDPQTGHQIVVWYGRDADLEAQMYEQEMVFEEVDGTGKSLGRTFGRLSLRWTPRWEMEHLLAGCGFVVESVASDFADGLYTGYGNQIWVARKE